jgi:hypothetical protein
MNAQDNDGRDASRFTYNDHRQPFDGIGHKDWQETESGDNWHWGIQRWAPLHLKACIENVMRGYLMGPTNSPDGAGARRAFIESFPDFVMSAEDTSDGFVDAVRDALIGSQWSALVCEHCGAFEVRKPGLEGSG